MNFKKTVFLALLLLLAGVYIYYVELPERKAQSTKNQAFLGVKQGEIGAIEISSDAGSYKLINSAPSAAQEDAQLNKWRIDGLPDATLDQGSLSTLISALLSLDTGDALPAEELDKDMRVYELDRPKLKLKVAFRGQSQQLEFGKTNEFVGKRYLRFDRKPEVYLVADNLFSQASRPREDLRDRTPLDFVDADLAAIAINSGAASEALRIEASDKLAWRIAAPIKAKASYSAVSAYTTSLRNLRADEFIDAAADKVESFGLNKPAVTVTLDFKPELKRAPLEVLVSRVAAADKEKNDGAPISYIQIKGRSSVFKSNLDLSATLKKSVEDLREKRLFEFSTDNVQQVDFESAGSEPLSVVKSGEKWSVNAKEADAVFVRQLLSNLSALEAVDFPLENREFGFDRPRLKVLVRLAGTGAEKDKGREMLLSVGSKTDSKEERYFAALDKGEEPFIISAEALKGITPKLESLLKSVATPAPLLTASASSN